jgi:thiamine biosynthesis protein ThiI
LLKNIKKAFRYNNLQIDAITRIRGRIYITTADPASAVQCAARVFGISSVSPAKLTTSSINDITQTALEIAKNTMKDGNSFAVRCHRVGEQPYTSLGVCKEIGSQIQTNLQEKKLAVNLSKPDHTLSIEIRDEQAFVYTETIHGQGGFPLGAQAKTVCLLSGGIDSPVACWLVMKRGSPTIPIYVDNNPYTDERAQQKAIETARKLREWTAGTPNKIYLIPNGQNIKKIQEKAPEKFTCLLCKRLMYRIAERIAEKEKAFGIVTGEAIGEQASQTITNLLAIDEAATRFPIHRPLLGFDKTETETIARKIGTMQVSTKKAQGCTAAPCLPATRAKLQAVKDAEANLNMEEMAQEAVQAAQIIPL